MADDCRAGCCCCCCSWGQTVGPCCPLGCGCGCCSRCCWFVGWCCCCPWCGWCCCCKYHGGAAGSCCELATPGGCPAASTALTPCCWVAPVIVPAPAPVPAAGTAACREAGASPACSVWPVWLPCSTDPCHFGTGGARCRGTDAVASGSCWCWDTAARLPAVLGHDAAAGLVCASGAANVHAARPEWWRGTTDGTLAAASACRSPSPQPGAPPAQPVPPVASDCSSGSDALFLWNKDLTPCEGCAIGELQERNVRDHLQI